MIHCRYDCSVRRGARKKVAYHHQDETLLHHQRVEKSHEDNKHLTITVSRLPRVTQGLPNCTAADVPPGSKIAPIPAGRLERDVRCDAEGATHGTGRPPWFEAWHVTQQWLACGNWPERGRATWCCGPPRGIRTVAGTAAYAIRVAVWMRGVHTTRSAGADRASVDHGMRPVDSGDGMRTRPESRGSAA